ncbi:TPA: VOC family protein [Streptococcus suis]
MYNSQFELGHVALNVRDLELQSLFYQQVLGLQVLSKSPHQIDLGVGKNILVPPDSNRAERRSQPQLRPLPLGHCPTKP